MRATLRSLLYSSFPIVLVCASSALAAPSPKGDTKAGGSPASIQSNEEGVRALTEQNYEAAEKHFRAALAADSRNLTAAFNLGGVLIAQKKPQDAISLLTPLANSDAKDAGIFVRLGDAYFATRNIDAATSWYEKAHKIAPKYNALSGKLGTVYLLRNNTKQAEEMFRAAVDQNPKSAQYLSNLSSVFLANGKAQDAIGTAKRALQIQSSPELYVTLGAAYEMLKDYKNSLISFQRAKDLGYAGKELPGKITEIEKKAAS